VRVGVVDHHRRKLQGVGSRLRHGGAHDAGGVPDEERHLLLGHELRGDDEVTLVLAVRVVDDHDQASLGQCGQSVLDRLGRHHVAHAAVSSSATWVPKTRPW
jgi:hypothetical protein